MGLYMGGEPVKLRHGVSTCNLNYLAKSPTLLSGYDWYKSETNRSSFTRINIVNNYNPTGNETETWNADVEDNGSIKCYVDGTTLIISGNKSARIICSDNCGSSFGGFSNVTTITGLRLLDTSNVISMECMFYNCHELTTLDLSNFDTSKVETMVEMFFNCDSLTTLDLSNFDTSKVTHMSMMFRSCRYLTTIYASDLWSTDVCTNSSDMFTYCINLTGDIPYNASYVDKTYATTTGGYLTYKEAPSK